ncbi:UNVERIFIED_CONTAM: G-type lectin S-receptor-like serine/threonine-protein kinase [Sesamum calycinum]|uniref:G-type lectin S-receptor-like serine/threonine-protein kinase n=1 Tax=Sesamum calycinum TaxID=2727403 RepID=A0AAW2Q5D1_9LAMI
MLEDVREIAVKRLGTLIMQHNGLFSVKSDVYSFVVLVLAIVSGLKNRGFHHKDHHHNFPGHAWLLHEERRSLELVDTINLVYLFVSEAMRLIRVALLCGQHSPEDRPSMSSVVLMLSREGALPQPKQPGFFCRDKRSCCCNC